MQFIIHTDLLYQETCPQQILKKIGVTITAAEYLQLPVEGKEKLFTCNNYNGVNSLK